MAKIIAILVFDQFLLLDAAGRITAFEAPARGISPPPYRIKVLARRAGAVTSSSGARVYAEAMKRQRRIDTLIVVGGLGKRAAMGCSQTLAFVRRCARYARRVCSVCSGSYVLAAAGVLEGRRASTHWRESTRFAQMFPNVHLDPDQIYTRDGNIWTSAGVTAGIDMALALIAEDLGETVAKRVAQELVVYYRRPGGQSQFSPLLEIGAPEHRFTGLLAWIREHVGSKHTVAKLAARVHMSARNFSRAFTFATSLSPAKAVERIRLDIARERVESSDSPIECIAEAVGFGEPERMRRAFVRTFGQSPQGLRRAARGAR
jgi:transcriptional regulator GlxA family with amidase domain